MLQLHTECGCAFHPLPLVLSPAHQQPTSKSQAAGVWLPGHLGTRHRHLHRLDGAILPVVCLPDAPPAAPPFISWCRELLSIISRGTDEQPRSATQRPHAAHCARGARQAARLHLHERRRTTTRPGAGDWPTKRRVGRRHIAMMMMDAGDQRDATLVPHAVPPRAVFSPNPSAVSHSDLRRTRGPVFQPLPPWTAVDDLNCPAFQVDRVSLRVSAPRAISLLAYLTTTGALSLSRGGMNSSAAHRRPRG